MTLLHRLASVLRGMFRRERSEQELNSELQAFVDLSAAEKMRDGMPEAEARRQAILELGGVEQVKERVRTYRHGALLEQVLYDAHYAFRTFKKNPGFVLIVVSILALGIGANTAIFSLMNALMLKSLPVREPERLVEMRFGTHGQTFSNPVWEQVRDRRELFDGALGFSERRYNLASGGEAHFINGVNVSGSYFEVLGIRPVIGRIFSENDDRRGCDTDGELAVLSYSYWKAHFGGANDVIGKPIGLDGRNFTIIGVSAAGFSGLHVGRSFDVATPLCTSSPLDNARIIWINVVGRLKEGMTLDETEKRLRDLQPVIRQATMPPDADAKFSERYGKEPLALMPAAAGMSHLRDRHSEALFVLLTITGLVLLVTCGNISSLLLARATARTREIAVRLSIGASRSRLVRQLLIESVLLALCGAATGLILAPAASRLLIRSLSDGGPQVFLDMSLDWRVLVFTIAAGLTTGILFGIIPALRTTRWNPADTLRVISACAVASRGRVGAGRWLVSFQMGLSLVLVFGAALFLHSYWRLTSTNHGFTPKDVLVIETVSRGPSDFGVSGELPYARESAPFYSQVLETLQAIPGVESAAYSFMVPLSGSAFYTSIRADGYQPQSDRDSDVALNLVSPRYFETLGTRLIAGRDFSIQDIPDPDARVAIVNEAFARKFLSGADPVGQIIRVSRDGIPTEIVGLVQDSKYTDLPDAFPPTMYQPVSHRISPGWTISVKTSAGATAVAPAIVRRLGEVDRNMGFSISTFESQILDSLIQERMLARLSAFFGILALFIAAVGLAGLVSYSITRRRAEIGIRAALGATPNSLVRLVMNDVARMIAVAVISGAFGGLAITRFVGAMLYEIKPNDPATLVIAAGTLIAVVVAAAYVPARRAARIDPIECLRTP